VQSPVRIDSAHQIWKVDPVGLTNVSDEVKQAFPLTLEPGGAEPVVSAVVFPLAWNSVEPDGQPLALFSCLKLIETLVVAPLAHVIVPEPLSSALGGNDPEPPVFPPHPESVAEASDPLRCEHVNVGSFLAQAGLAIAPPTTKVVTATLATAKAAPLINRISSVPFSPMM